MKFHECSKDLRAIIKESVEFENERTGYNMKLVEDELTITDERGFYHMSRELDYEDYTIKIYNQGNVAEGIEECYAYEITIFPKRTLAPPIEYRLYDIPVNQRRYYDLPKWETLLEFFESDELKQSVIAYKTAYKKLKTAIEEDIEKKYLGEEDE